MSAPGSRAKRSSSSVKGQTKVALHCFQYLALLVVEQLARGFALWRERGRRFFRLEHGHHMSPASSACRSTLRTHRAQIADDLVELDRRTINAAAVAELLLPTNVLFFPA
jgi:hypothetical protein